MRWIVRLGVLVLLAVLTLRLRDRQAVIAAADRELAADGGGLRHDEGYIDDLDARIDDAVARLRETDGRVSAVEASHPEGIPAAERDDYDALLARRNEIVGEHNDLIGRRQAAVEEYRRRVGSHDARVARANAYAADSTPWRVLQGLWASVTGRGG